MIVNVLLAGFCTLVIAAGWYYLARSPIVDALQPFESPRRNKTRRKARRMGAWGMILAALAGYWLVLEMRWQTSPPRMASALLLVTFALCTMTLSVMVDVYLTRRLTQEQRRNFNARPKRSDDEHP